MQQKRLLDTPYNVSANKHYKKYLKVINILSLVKKESILEFLAFSFKKSEIARRLGKNRSSIGREIERNSIDRKYSPYKT